MSSSADVIYLLHTPDITLGNSALNKLRSWLNASEHQRMAHFKSAAAQHHYLLARALLRGQLATHCNTPAASLQFTQTDNGKPHLREQTANTYFNLSHSGQWLALAVSHQEPVGVDIEHPQKKRDLISIARHYFHPSEYHYLQQLADENLPQAFYRLWTLKEAFFKARGTGISEGLARIRFSDANNPISAELDPALSANNNPWQFHYWHNPQGDNSAHHLAFAQQSRAHKAPAIKRVTTLC